jgi:hypothetical protein
MFLVVLDCIFYTLNNSLAVLVDVALIGCIDLVRDLIFRSVAPFGCIDLVRDLTL